jgi:subfamily B ATP-binding cassette protein HlyB/CyaB
VPPALVALCIVAHHHHIPADAAQLQRSLGLEATADIGMTELLLGAKALGLVAKSYTTDWTRLDKLTFPVMAELAGNNYIVILKKEANGDLLIADPRLGRPAVVAQDSFTPAWTGRLLLLKPTLEQSQASRPFGLSWFLPAIWKYRRLMGEILAAAFVIQLFGLGMPLFTQVMIDKVLMHKSLSTLHVLAVGMLLAILFEGILTLLRQHLLAHTTNRIDVTLGARLVSHMLRMPLRYFEARRVGDTMSRVRGLEAIRQFITGASLNAAMDLLFVVVFIAVMFLYSVPLTFVLLGMLPLFILLSVVMAPLMRERMEEKFDRSAESQAFLVESVTGIQTVKAMALEPLFQRKWEMLLARYVSASYNASYLGGIANALGQVIQKLSALIILWVGAYLVIDGRMSVGQLIAFQMLSGRVISPVLRVVQLWQEFQQVSLSVDRLKDIMNTPAEPALSAGRIGAAQLGGAVKLQDVRFRYSPETPPILKGLSLEVPPGKVVGIVGRSGSGKSTLAKLLQRLYVPESGTLTVGGIDLQQADPTWLRRQIGVVLQESFLFSGSVRENIAVQMPNASMEQIIEAAKLGGAHDFIVELPQGYDTPVGERGAALSGGQRQRIAIARALLGNPSMLILDEATSALDYESERAIQDNLASICQGRTVFIITHRLSMIRRADTILVLDKGELVEQGTHAELLARQGLYFHLSSQQEAHAHAVA